MPTQPSQTPQVMCNQKLIVRVVSWVALQEPVGQLPAWLAAALALMVWVCCRPVPVALAGSVNP